MPPRRPSSDPQQIIEWAGGIVDMAPQEGVVDDSPLPKLLIWVQLPEKICGYAIGWTQEELLKRTPASLAETLNKPGSNGPVTPPTHIRVASKAMYQILQQTLPEQIALLHCPTPEVDRVGYSLSAYLHDDEPGRGHVFSEFDDDRVAHYFVAAAALYRSAPWRLIPDSDQAIALSIPALGVHRRAVIVVGQEQQSYGLAIFANLSDLHKYSAQAKSAATEREEIFAQMPTHIMINFDRAENIETDLRRQIGTCHWEVASTAAYPSVLVASRDGLRAADADELLIAEALALAMPAWLVPRQKLRRAGEGRGSHTLRTSVATFSREVEVELSFPFEA